MPTYLVSPLVPGDLGPGTELDRSVHPPVVNNLHVVLDNWLGDDLIESFPIYLATEALATKIDQAGLTGVSWAPVQVSKDVQAELFFDWELPAWRWLQPAEDRRADFWVDELARLHVSHRALETLNSSNIRHAEVTEDPDPLE